MGNAWVIGSHVTPSYLGLLSRTAILMKEKGIRTDAILTDGGMDCRQAGLVKAAGACQVCCLPLDDRDLNCELQAVSSLKYYYEREKPDYILFESSVFFSSVAPSFAAAVACGITADCTELSWHQDGKLLQIRPAFGGSRIASNVNAYGTAVATVRKGVFHLDLPRTYPASEFRVLALHGQKGNWTLVADRVADEISAQNLQDASLIVAGGLGMGSRSNYGRLYELARLSGAAVAASRAAVAAGFAGYDHQVGQTGVSVRPELYIAFGISGAVQHLSGMIGAKRIVAINSDPSAPIHRYSHLSVIADCNMMVDRLIRRLIHV